MPTIMSLEGPRLGEPSMWDSVTSIFSPAAGDVDVPAPVDTSGPSFWDSITSVFTPSPSSADEPSIWDKVKGALSPDPVMPTMPALPSAPAKTSMKTIALIGGGVALVGLAAYFVFGKSSKPTAAISGARSRKRKRR